MYVQFHRLIYRNFLSTGNSPIEIDFRKCPKTLIVGTNGVGKSTIISALSFALFGKDFRGINKPGLVNSVNRRELETIVEFSAAGKEYKIVRGIKPNKFEIWIDGVEQPQMPNVNEQQEWFESNVLRASLNSFRQVVFLGTDFVPFMKLPAAMRRSVIEDLWDLTVFSRMNDVLKKRLSDTKDRLATTVTGVSVARAKIDVIRDRLARDRARLAEDVDRKRTEIAEIEGKVAELVGSAAEIAATIAKIEAKHAELNGRTATLPKLELRHREIKLARDRVARELKFFSEHDVCPTCTQGIDAVIKSEKMEESSVADAALATEFDELDVEIDRLKKIRTKMDELMVAVNELRRNAASVDAEISANRRAIVKLQTDITDVTAHNTIDADEIEVAKLMDGVRELECERETLTRQRDVRLAAVPFLKDDGVKANIVDSYIPVVNRLINEYLAKFNFYVQFELDSDFNETIRSRYRDDFQYANFSAGERQRIDLAILLAWREIARMRNSVATSILFLDETLDSSMDANGISDLMTILGERPDLNLFVISHRENMEDQFDRTLQFTKNGHFTTMTEK